MNEKNHETIVGSKVENNANSNAATSSTTQSYTASINTNESRSIQYGWVCPKCGKVNAPWKDHCDCNDMPYYLYWQGPNTPILCSNPTYKHNENVIAMNANPSESYVASCTCDCCNNHKDEDKENK